MSKNQGLESSNADVGFHWKRQCVFINIDCKFAAFEWFCTNFVFVFKIGCVSENISLFSFDVIGKRVVLSNGIRCPWSKCFKLVSPENDGSYTRCIYKWIELGTCPGRLWIYKYVIILVLTVVVGTHYISVTKSYICTWTPRRRHDLLGFWHLAEYKKYRVNGKYCSMSKYDSMYINTQQRASAHE